MNTYPVRNLRGLIDGKECPRNAARFCEVLRFAQDDPRFNFERTPISNSLAHKDGDALGEGLRGLSIKTSPEFECICSQSFASFAD
jgi:hypothetical protein